MLAELTLGLRHGLDLQGSPAKFREARQSPLARRSDSDHRQEQLAGCFGYTLATRQSVTPFVTRIRCGRFRRKASLGVSQPVRRLLTRCLLTQIPLGGNVIAEQLLWDSG